MAVYYHRTINLPCAPVIAWEFVPADFVDPDKKVRPSHCPRCKVSTSVAYYENVPGRDHNSAHQHLFCCRGCLIERFEHRALFSREELAARDFMTNLKLSGLAEGIPRWPLEQRVGLGHSYHLCWECGTHVGSDPGMGYSMPSANLVDRLAFSYGIRRVAPARCLGTPLVPTDRLFCGRCAVRYGLCGPLCSRCELNTAQPNVNGLGRVCEPCGKTIEVARQTTREGNPLQGPPSAPRPTRVAPKESKVL